MSRSAILESSPRWCYDQTDNCHHNYNAADIFAPTGTRVVSPVAGTVISATTSSSGVGSRVQIRDTTGEIWYLAHMHHSPGLSVSDGSSVSPGTPIGVVGTSSHAVGTPPHLHIDRLPSSYSSRPSCSGAACAQYAFENVQADLAGLFRGTTGPTTPGTAINDVNGDGFSDLLAISGDELLAYFGNAGGGFAPGMLVNDGWGDMRLGTLGNFVGSALADFTAIGPDGHLYTYRNNGNLSFTTVGDSRGWSTYQLGGSADFNSDGRADFVATSNGALKVLAGAGTGGFTHLNTGGTGWSGWQLGGAGDFTGDGRADFLAAKDGDLWVYPGRGDGTFSTPTRLGSGWTSARLGTAADYDANGRLDFVAIIGTTMYQYKQDLADHFVADPLGSGWTATIQLSR